MAKRQTTPDHNPPQEPAAKVVKKRKGGKRIHLSQTEFPTLALPKSLPIAVAIWNDYAGKSATPAEIADSMKVATNSSSWRNICGSSVAYGLTDGNFTAKEISLTPLGRQVVASTENDLPDMAPRVQALLKPRIMRELLLKYDESKFPREEVARQALINLGLPRERAAKGLSILKDSCQFAGVLQEGLTGTFVRLGNPTLPALSDLTEDDTSGDLALALESNDSLLADPTLIEPSPRRHTETAVAEYVAPAQALRRGLEVDVYTLQERLGAGYSAEVWSALVTRPPPGVELQKNAQVAIKIYHSYAMALPDQVVRVEREFRIAQRLRHPHLVRIYEFMLASPRPHHCFLVMDLAKGKLLKDVAAAASLKLPQSLKILLQIARALDELHSAGAIHRDIKPSNISVELSPTSIHATLLDLGIVSVTYERNVTAGSRFVGSKHWAPYEQLMGLPLDERSDIYSLGALAYNLLSGVEPFSASSTEAAIAVQMATKPLSIPRIEGVPIQITEMINSMLSFKPESRPRTARELISVLEKYTS